VENIQVIAEGKFVNLCVFCKTIPELPTLTFIVAALNNFPHIPNRERMTPTTKSEAANAK
jgi:hypothetical protein